MVRITKKAFKCHQILLPAWGVGSGNETKWEAGASGHYHAQHRGISTNSTFIWKSVHLYVVKILLNPVSSEDSLDYVVKVISLKK